MRSSDSKCSEKREDLKASVFKGLYITERSLGEDSVRKAVAVCLTTDMLIHVRHLSLY